MRNKRVDGGRGGMLSTLHQVPSNWSCSTIHVYMKNFRIKELEMRIKGPDDLMHLDVVVRGGREEEHAVIDRLLLATINLKGRNKPGGVSLINVFKNWIYFLVVIQEWRFKVLYPGGSVSFIQSMNPGKTHGRPAAIEAPKQKKKKVVSWFILCQCPEVRENNYLVSLMLITPKQTLIRHQGRRERGEHGEIKAGVSVERFPFHHVLTFYDIYLIEFLRRVYRRHVGECLRAR